MLTYTDDRRQLNLGWEVLQAFGFQFANDILNPSEFELGAWILEDADEAYRVLAIGVGDDNNMYYASLHQTECIIKVLPEADLVSWPNFDVDGELRVLAGEFAVVASVTSREYSYESEEWLYELSGFEAAFFESGLEEILLEWESD